jgi:hypothetical protein
MGQHWLFLTVLGFSVAGVVFLALWWAYGRLILSGGPKGQSLRRKLPFFRRSSKSDYELLARQA